ncbi:paired amphipathic helix, partial [Mycena latifolia]
NDTIAYLEAIKKQLSNQPDVYGRFLDILKDFKGEIIDTHGAVQAVVRLFYGNHELIQGFAVFLPAGYAIDVSQNP